MKLSKQILLLLACLTWPTMPQSALAFSIAAMGNINLNGNRLGSDSFDSADPNYSTNGFYHPDKRKAGGDILTSAALTNSNFMVGNLNIAGKIRTGPYGTFYLGSNSSVGDITWLDQGMTGVQPGWAADDMNFVFENVVLPNTSWLPTGIVPGVGGSGVVDGIFYDHVFTLNGDFQISNGNNTIYVGTNTSVRLRVTAGTFKPDYIYVAGTGTAAGKMTAYLDGTTTAVLGTDHYNQSGKAENFIVFGLPSVTSLAYKGNGDIAAVIYAPQADFQLASGGSGTIDFIGMSVTRTVQLNGHYYFHFDENLRRIFPFANPIFISLPQNKTVVAGQNATFTVSATSNLPLTYQWNFLPLGGGSSVPIPNATNNTVTITNVTTDNQGHYSVIVSNAMMSASSSNALLTVLSPAPVLSQPFSPASGQIQFDVVGIAGSNYVVLASTNFADWSPMFTNVSPFTFIETNPSTISASFYRALYLP